MSAIPNVAPWLQAVLAGDAPHKFPYHYADTASKTIELDTSLYPEDQLKTPPQFKPPKKQVAYVLTIPLLAEEDFAKTAEKLDKLASVIKNQAFYEKDCKEAPDVNERVFVVFGVNCPHSLDTAQNEAFVISIRQFQKITKVNAVVIGTQWHPKIMNPGSSRVSPSKKANQELEKKAHTAFQSLKEANLEKALQVQGYLRSQKCTKKNKSGDEVESRKTRLRRQIPYQQIRDWLKNESLPWIQFLLSQPDAPTLYFGCLDGDTLSLNGEGQEMGLLKTYDRMVLQSTVPPMLMSTGYFFPQDVDSVTALANRIDMHIRTYMAKYAPLFLYYPEPNLFILLNELCKGPEWITKFSFVGGAGNDTEARRLLENLTGYLQVDRVRFVASRCLITTPPKRMIASKSKLGALSFKDLTPDVLKSMRGISQTHFKPNIWASNVYSGLKVIERLPEGITQSRTVTAIFMHIFNVFDITAWGFDLAITRPVYQEFINGITANWDNINSKKMDKSTLTIKQDYFIEKCQYLHDQIQKLSNKGFQDSEILSIVQTAMATGYAVFETLNIE